MATSVASSFQIRFGARSKISRDLWQSSPNANGWKCLNLSESYKLGRSIHRSLRGSLVVSPMAIGANTSQDTDDMYDDMFKKYGKVVYKRNDQKSPTAEVDDDAECLAFAVALAKIASDVKAADIKLLFVKPLVYWTKFFLITTAFSRPQIDAIRTRINDLAETQYGKFSTGDSKPNSWTLLDFGDIVVHIFLPEQRELYNLEEFYANATPIELPFENQQSFNR
ncbi:protein Iojap, chloroplastic [Cynara cardunculus var. scolymus]|uniref:protein Iojap, chloroplastic n=1 Tax=Cynara cardunculus var. scolymus TaxID=59895 RepID=UPI000D6280EF|nr:protein Iojap, chloroplastic [Cynara cardunculus var. scolymus]